MCKNISYNKLFLDLNEIKYSFFLTKFFYQKKNTIYFSTFAP